MFAPTYKLYIAPLLLLELALLITPVVRISRWVTMHDQQRMAEILLLLLLTLGCLLPWRAGVFGVLARIPRTAIWLWLLGLMFGLFSALNAAHLRFAALEWASLVLLGAGAFALAAQSKSQADAFDRWAMRVGMLAAFFILLKFLLNYSLVLHAGLTLESGKLFRGSFMNPRFFGQAATLILPLLAYPLLSTQYSRAWKIAAFALLSMFWMMAIASGTRGTFLGLVAASVVLAFVAWQQVHRWLLLQIAGFLAGLAIFALLFGLLPDIAQHPGITAENRLENPLTLSKRETVWILAWQQIVAHPWLGIGPMHLASIPNPVAAHPHNALLQLGAEWGIPAMLMLVSPLVYGMWTMLARIRQAHVGQSGLWVCLAASLLGASAQAMVDGVIVMPYTQMLLIYVIGWAIGMYFRDTKVSMIPASGLATATTLLVLAMVLLVWGVFPEFLQRAEITRSLVENGITMFHPRYWAQGWIP